MLVNPASAQESVDPTGIEEADSAGEPEAAQRKDELQQARGIEKILIIGEKQNTLQGAPISSTSFSAGELQALRVEDIADLADYTPNLEINTSFAASNPTIFIRGIGLKDYNANAAGAVAIYQDGVNINSPAIQLGQLFDMEGIEVLRGPQGSVNGRNATAGAIMIRSAMPDSEFGVSTNLTYGNYDKKEVKAAINLPLIKDMLSMRVSGTAHWRDGYTKNQCAGWNPEAYGFRRNDAASNTEIYNALQPTGQYDAGVLREVHVIRQNGKPLPDSMIYLNYALAEEVRSFTSGVNTGTRINPIVLAEDLFDEAGALVAAAGTPVATQAITFNLQEFDGICIRQTPGKVATMEGQFNHPGESDWEAENWRADRVQPGLEDFASLDRWTNAIDKWAARMILVFEPLDYMDWMVNFHGAQNRGDSAHMQMLGATSSFRRLGFTETPEAGFSEHGADRISGWRLGEGARNVPGIENAANPGQGGGNPYSGFYSSDGTEYIDTWGVNGKGFFDLGFATVTLLYDYEWYDRVVEDEGDATPLRLFPAIWSDSAWQTTGELRIEGERERYSWVGGLFFLYEDLGATNDFPDTRQFSIKQKFSQTLTSGALYVAGEVDLVAVGVIPGIHELGRSGPVTCNSATRRGSTITPPCAPT
jgi:hypothetical protein